MAPSNGLSRSWSRRSQRLDSQDLERCSEANNGHTRPNIIQLNSNGNAMGKRYDGGSEDGEARVEEKIPGDDVLSGHKERDGSVLEAAVCHRQSVESGQDPELVTWDGPDDPENPKNWSTKRRWLATIVVSCFTFISPVSSSMLAPALPAIAKDLNISTEVESQMVLSVFILAYAIGPLFLGPLSEVYGRVPVLQLANLVYLIFNSAAGGCKTKGEMIAFRFLSGLGGSAPQSDSFQFAPLLGPAIGPIMGGFVTEHTTWRWVFYVTSFADVLIQFMGLFFLRETYAPKILHLKAKKLRRETGNPNLHTAHEQAEGGLLDLLKNNAGRPFRLLGTQPIVQVLCIYIAYIYGLMYLILATFPVLWTERYHESIGIAGLNYLSMAVGFTLGVQILSPLNDRFYSRLKRKNNGVGKPEFRVPTMIPGSVMAPVGIFIYAWTAQFHTHWMGPNVGIAIFSAGTIAAITCVQVILVDIYTQYAASAIAATRVLSNIAGFAFPLFAPY
ncbi:MAG: hypothetical protein Q9174_002774, partial [Haloplaca sp. 1 TL-2023]